MGQYLNPGNAGFQTIINREIYVDKSMFLAQTNKMLDTSQRFFTMLQPKGFGKTTSVQMLIAYYDKSYDSSSLFQKLNISNDSSYTQHLNKHNVICLDIQNFLHETHDINALIKYMNDVLTQELIQNYDVNYFDKRKLSRVLGDIYVSTNETFIFIVDNWDCVFWETKNNKEVQERYLDYLRLLVTYSHHLKRWELLAQAL